MTLKKFAFNCMFIAGLTASTMLATPSSSLAGEGSGLVVPVNRSELVVVPTDMAEVIVSDPSIADVSVHGATRVSIIGKKLGVTNVRIFDKSNNILKEFQVTVGYDLPSIRKAMKEFLPYEKIGVEMVNTNVALTGEVTSASAADRAIRIASEFVKPLGSNEAASGDDQKIVGKGGESLSKESPILNLMQISSGQQVMLRVRVGELQRNALKKLGVNFSAIDQIGKTILFGGSGGGLAPFNPELDPAVPFGSFLIDGDSRGALGASYQLGDTNLAGMVEALERDGLFKVLAEPNLVSLSGEKAEFLAGGEFPVPVPQDNGTISVEFKPFGVAVQFTPYVLSENRIRVSVMPEVSEISDAGAVEFANFRIPSLTTRRANATVELAPGESFMIAGLISDRMTSNIDQFPGMRELPILGALFRSTSFQRNESELVIAVTPYIVDPMKGGDVKLPTDNLVPASQMEMLFYGALGTLSGDSRRKSQTPNLEGPIGFMVD